MSLAELEDDETGLFVRPAWHARAACRGAGTAIFFPDKHNNQHTVEQALAYCARCEVVGECAAAGRGERYGLWAGGGDRQRRKLRRLR